MTQFRSAMLAAVLGGAVLGGAVLVATTAASAQAVSGLYIGFGAGLNMLQNNDVSVDALPGRSVGNGSAIVPSAPGKIGWGMGYVMSGSVGYGMGNGVRLELEGSYRNANQDRTNGGGGGQQTQFGLMGNVLYDVDVGLNWLYPYIGVGAGYQYVSWNNVSVSVSGVDYGNSPTTATSSQTLGGVAYQAMIGVSFPVDYVPGLAVTAEYRYLNMASSRNFRATGNTPYISATQSNNTTHIHQGGDGNHSVLLGIRYAFGAPDAAPVLRTPVAAPMPAPVPVPAALPMRTYLVFFDWDRADLTPRARDIIAEAVRNSVRIPHTRIEVTGHADRSGSPQANQMLSLRRAQAVASELERWGVPSQAIDMHAVGDTRPMVPTAIGARDAQNRVVEIVYR